MALVEVDAVGAEPAQRLVARAPDVAGREVDAGHPPGALLERVAELRRDRDAIAIGGERAAEDRLAVAGAVHVRRVEERHAQLEAAPDSRDRVVVVDVAPARRLAGGSERPTDRPAAEAEGAHRCVAK
jgi:hypothetical protein